MGPETGVIKISTTLVAPKFDVRVCRKFTVRLETSLVRSTVMSPQQPRSTLLELTWLSIKLIHQYWPSQNPVIDGSIVRQVGPSNEHPAEREAMHAPD